MNFLFSIIVPVYNSEKTIEKCLNSIKRQKINDFELIIIDDNSSDNSLQIANKFIKKIKFVKILKNKKNYGVSISRNRGIKNSNGKYIIFLDSDDILLKRSLINLKKKVINNKQDYYFIKSIDLRNNKIDHNSVTYSKKRFKFFAKHIKNNFHFRPTCWNFICKRNFILANQLFFKNIRLYEDQIFVSKLINLSQAFEIISKPIYARSTETPNSLGKSIGMSLGNSCLRCILDLIKLIHLNKNKINKTNLIFILSRISFLLQDFNLNIFSSSDEEIKKYSSFIYKNKELFEEMNNLKLDSKEFHFLKKNYFIKKKRKIMYELILYRNSEVEKVIKKFPNHSKSKNYLFCANQVSKIISKICYVNNIKIDGIIDNNKFFINKIIGKTKILSSKNLNEKIKENINLNIMICSIEKNLIKNLKKKLIFNNKVLVNNIIK
tara:strand:+ start:1313 stop:2620 length:1308 start_codon:yes stop_codon:yes gene_type:complete